jgi:hypothetical protein
MFNGGAKKALAELKANSSVSAEKVETVSKMMQDLGL